MYSFAISVYMVCVHIAAFFGHKNARKMVRGHLKVFQYLKENIDENAQYLWFHAASLGEFEQGRPLMERYRREHPEYKILLTFFSPSGYEVRKNYEGADLICYLPFDTLLHSHRFVKLVQPKKAFFIKYEFWRNYIEQLAKTNCEIYSVSSIFRPDQIFFRWYGFGYARCLKRFTHFFVQNQQSIKLLARIGVYQTTLVGDTRFDRVIDIKNAAKPLPLVEKFCENEKVLIVGSSWQPDEDIIIPYFNTHPEMKLILAPHVVSKVHLREIAGKLERPAKLFSQAVKDNRVDDVDCLIIDCYGMLSSIYRYAYVAYVGGGFGVGIHNVPEAAVYSVPVIFGPNNKRFREAQALLANGGAREIKSAEDFNTLMDEALKDPEGSKRVGLLAGSYILGHAGATDKIYRIANGKKEEK